MNANNRLEMFLALNAEAFKRGLSAASAGVRHMAGGVSTAMTETKTKFQEGLGAVSNYNAGLREQHGITQLLTGSITSLIVPLTGLFSIITGAHKLVDVTREFDKLSAGLITATGSAAEAKPAFAAIQDFAARTPYDLAQVTDSFVKLVNFGLNPSERAMTSYGNTSSALGKELNQMIEAVADAATGEFERLKEFGIKASSEGDKVSFTFRGITETVGKNAKEIEDYLIKLGETNFGDAMANRMSTLDGALSNLGDEWDKLFLNISQQGIGDVIADGVRVGIDALEELNAMIVSGELEGYLNAYAGKWSAWAEDVKNSITSVTKFFSGEMAGVETRGSDAVAFLTDAFRNFPENVRAFIGILVVEMASGFDRLKADAKAFKDSIKAVFTSSTLDEVEAERLRQLEIFRKAREESIDAILRERDAAINSSKAQIEATKTLRGEYEKKRAAETADTTDRLEKYQVKDSAERKQAKDFSDKSTAKFIQDANGEWREVPGSGRKASSSDAKSELVKGKEKPTEERKKTRVEVEERTATRTEPAKQYRQYRIINGQRYAVGDDEYEQPVIKATPDDTADRDPVEKKPKKRLSSVARRSDTPGPAQGEPRGASSWPFGIDIAKVLQQAAAKTTPASMPGGDLFGDLSGRISGQLATVASRGAGQAMAAAAPAVIVHELRFAGGSLRGGETDVEALLDLLAQAGMSAG